MKKVLSGIGEFGFINRIAGITHGNASVIKGIGDDCAVLRYKNDRYLLITTDMIIEGVHFLKAGTAPESIGHKALAVNISDIAACAGIPKWAVVSMGIPAKTPSDYAVKIYKGLERLARYFKVALVGGDTNASEDIVISVTVAGEVSKKDLVLRSGAKEKDAIVMSGKLCAKPEHMRFLPRLKQSRFIARRLMPTAMIDISDGLLSDLNHIVKGSRKKAVLYEPLIPFKGKRRRIKELLNRGEQFELLFTMPAKMLKFLPRGFYPIGEMVRGRPEIVYVEGSGSRRVIEPKGYTHF